MDNTNVILDGLTADVHFADEGGYWAEVPGLPGCVTEADTLDELVANLNDAIEGWLSVQTPASLTALGVTYHSAPQADQEASKSLPKFASLRFAA